MDTLTVIKPETRSRSRDPSIGGSMRKAGKGLPLQLGGLRNFSAALIEIAEQVPERTTVAQTAFFLLAALADEAGKPATFTELREAVGPTINKSLHTTYQVFLDRKRRRSDSPSVTMGLGWLTREEDPIDNRRKYLRLTPRGRAVLKGLHETLKGAKVQ